MAFALFLWLWEVLFAPAALAAIGAEKIALFASVGGVDILCGGGHNVLAAGRTHERAGIAVERASNENTSKQSDEAYRYQKNSDPSFHLDKGGGENMGEAREDTKERHNI